MKKNTMQYDVEDILIRALEWVIQWLVIYQMVVTM